MNRLLLILSVAMLFVPASAAHASNLFAAFGTTDVHRFGLDGSDLGVFADISPDGFYGMAFDASGNLFTATFGFNVHKVSPTGVDLGSYLGGPGVFDNTMNVAVDHAGNLWVVDALFGLYNVDLHKYSPTGVDMGVMAHVDWIGSNFSIAFDSDDNVYVPVDDYFSGFHGVRKFSSTGADLGAFVSGLAGGPGSVAIDAGGNLYTATQTEIHKYSPTGTDLGTFASLYFGASNIVLDADGNLYSADWGIDGASLAIRKFAPDGTDLGTLENAAGFWLAISPVPEPSTFALAAVGLLGLFAVRFRRRAIDAAALLSVLTVLVADARAVTIDWVPVGNPGNPADTTVRSDGTSGYGSVAYNYAIGKYDVTIGQYTEFLNAVAKTDTHGLYSTGMADDPHIAGISRTGSPGSYVYSAIGSSASFPVTYVSWADAARFANWLQNGQPTGPQNAGTTEDGAYTLHGVVTNEALGAVTRNPTATVFIPSENEWYKAAYYNPDTGSYYLYPFSSNTKPTSAVPGNTPNTGNLRNGAGEFAVTGSTTYDPDQNYLTSVGTYIASASPYGAFDMGGNVFQWNEAAMRYGEAVRGVSGSTWIMNIDVVDQLSAAYRGFDLPWGQNFVTGFRVATVPEPSTLALAALSVVGLVLNRIRRRVPDHRSSIVCAALLICALLAADARAGTAFTSDFSSSTLSSLLQDVDGAFTIPAGTIAKTVFNDADQHDPAPLLALRV